MNITKEDKDDDDNEEEDRLRTLSKVRGLMENIITYMEGVFISGSFGTL